MKALGIRHFKAVSVRGKAVSIRGLFLALDRVSRRHEGGEA